MILMKNMKEDQNRFDLSKESILNRIETERIIKTNIFWYYQYYMDKGIDYDIRKNIYDKVSNFTMEALKSFLANHNAENYTMLVIGNKASVDINVLKKLGDYHELSLEELFNY